MLAKVKTEIKALGIASLSIEHVKVTLDIEVSKTVLYILIA